MSIGGDVDEQSEILAVASNPGKACLISPPNPVGSAYMSLTRQAELDEGLRHMC